IPLKHAVRHGTAYAPAIADGFPAVGPALDCVQQRHCRSGRQLAGGLPDIHGLFAVSHEKEKEPMNTTSLLPPGLPPLEDHLVKHLHAMHSHLAEAISAMPDGFMPFEQWMDLALYAPGLGYYAAGNTKFGGDLPTGDFTTAPEMTPVFARVLARQVAQVLEATGTNTVLEFGAGTGALAAALVPALRELGIEPEYLILELSADLAARQAQRLAPMRDSVQWLDALPEAFEGCVIANEVLDAMPVRLFAWNESGTLMETAVQARPGTTPPFAWAQVPADAAL